MSYSDIINIISISISSVLAIIAIVISVKTLKQSNKAIIESSRGNIVFYIDTPLGGNQYLVLKNFGNSSAILKNIKISPELTYSKSTFTSTNKLITEYSNILLAPGQAIKSWFPFDDYPDKEFKISLNYETLGHMYHEDYTLNLDYISTIDYLRDFSIDRPDEKSALLKISNNIKTLTEKI